MFFPKNNLGKECDFVIRSVSFGRFYKNLCFDSDGSVYFLFSYLLFDGFYGKRKETCI